jgi:hypothetical protein
LAASAAAIAAFIVACVSESMAASNSIFAAAIFAGVANTKSLLRDAAFNG